MSVNAAFCDAHGEPGTSGQQHSPRLRAKRQRGHGHSARRASKHASTRATRLALGARRRGNLLRARAAARRGRRRELPVCARALPRHHGSAERNDTAQ
jgi:hypothetical protein